MQRKYAEAVSQVWSSLTCGFSHLGCRAFFQGGTLLAHEISFNSTA